MITETQTAPHADATPAQVDLLICEVSDKIGRLRHRRDDQTEALTELGDQLADLHAAYRARRWDRYYLVPGGHVHSSDRCSTCNRNWVATQFAWLPADSGRTGEEMIAEYGWSMCTVCFPAAPLHPLYQKPGARNQADLDRKEQRRLELEAKRTAKEANTPRDEHGEPLRLSDRSTPSTVKGARNKMAELLNTAHWYRAVNAHHGYQNGNGHPSEAEWLADARACALAVARHEHRIAGSAIGPTVEQMAEELYSIAEGKGMVKAAKELAKALADGR